MTGQSHRALETGCNQTELEDTGMQVAHSSSAAALSTEFTSCIRHVTVSGDGLTVVVVDEPSGDVATFSFAAWCNTDNSSCTFASMTKSCLSSPAFDKFSPM